MFRIAAAVAHLMVIAQVIAVAVLTAVLIAVQHGRVVGFGQMDPGVQTFLYATIAAVSLFVSLIPYDSLKAHTSGILLDAWTKLVGIIAAVMAAWMGISGEAVDLTPIALPVRLPRAIRGADDHSGRRPRSHPKTVGKGALRGSQTHRRYPR